MIKTTRITLHSFTSEHLEFLTTVINCVSFLAGDALLLHDHSALDLRHPVQRRLRLFGRRRAKRIDVGRSGENILISSLLYILRHLYPPMHVSEVAWNVVPVSVRAGMPLTTRRSWRPSSSFHAVVSTTMSRASIAEPLSGAKRTHRGPSGTVPLVKQPSGTRSTTPSMPPEDWGCSSASQR